MKLYQSLDELPTDFFAGALTIGNFDGVHRGHARLLNRLKQRAKEANGPSVVFTFEPHPVRLLRPDEAPAPLTWVARKAELLARLDIDCVIAYPTSRKFLSLTASEYFQQIICDQLRTQAVVEGPNFFFGKGREGNVELLAEFCQRESITLEIVEPVRTDEEFVSSSRVRKAIAAGDVDAANAMLTQPYRIRGMITHGAGRGGSIGFPTANVSAVDTLLPGLGVYAGTAQVANDLFEPSQSWKAAINVGPNPTFGEDHVKVEVHLIEFKGDLYGQPLEVDFIRRLRDIQKFSSKQELIDQLQRDVAAASA